MDMPSLIADYVERTRGRIIRNHRVEEVAVIFDSGLGVLIEARFPEQRIKAPESDEQLLNAILSEDRYPYARSGWLQWADAEQVLLGNREPAWMLEDEYPAGVDA